MLYSGLSCARRRCAVLHARLGCLRSGAMLHASLGCPRRRSMLNTHFGSARSHFALLRKPSRRRDDCLTLGTGRWLCRDLHLLPVAARARGLGQSSSPHVLTGALCAHGPRGRGEGRGLPLRRVLGSPTPPSHTRGGGRGEAALTQSRTPVHPRPRVRTFRHGAQAAVGNAAALMRGPLRLRRPVRCPPLRRKRGLHGACARVGRVRGGGERTVRALAVVPRLPGAEGRHGR